MFLTADYHTHTTFSHGKGSILDNALVASKKGLKEIAITDHGFAHPAFGLRKRKVDKMIELCKSASVETGVNVLLGIESNIRGVDGTIDITPKMYDKFDMIVAGIHQFILYKFGTIFSLFLPNFFVNINLKRQASQRLINENTKTYINVIKNNPVDIISHVNYCSHANVVEVAKVAADYNTRIELNAKKVHITDEELYQMAKTGVHFMIDSDAHTPDRVGEISLVEQMLKRVNIPEEQIDNINGKIPSLRFNEFKSRCGA